MESSRVRGDMDSLGNQGEGTSCAASVGAREQKDEFKHAVREGFDYGGCEGIGWREFSRI